MRVLLTGHTKGIGFQLLKIMLEKGFEVTGVARTELTIFNNNLRQIKADLADNKSVKKLCKELSKQNLDLVILNAGYNHIKPAEGYTLVEIERIINVNFKTPSLIIRSVLPKLLKNKGTLVGIGSFSGIEFGRWNNFYGASKAAMHHLLKNIFEQYRKQHLRVINIIPDITASNFYDHQDFTFSDDELTFINPRELAEFIIQLIISKNKFIPLEVLIRPQKFEIKRKLK